MFFFPLQTDGRQRVNGRTSALNVPEASTKTSQEQPVFSLPQGHVLWDTALPANLGYMSAMFYNQNNCALEASTVTSKYEMEVGKDLCVMLGV